MSARVPTSGSCERRLLDVVQFLPVLELVQGEVPAVGAAGELLATARGDPADLVAIARLEPLLATSDPGKALALNATYVEPCEMPTDGIVERVVAEVG